MHKIYNCMQSDDGQIKMFVEDQHNGRRSGRGAGPEAGEGCNNEERRGVKKKKRRGLRGKITNDRESTQSLVIFLERKE